MEQFALYVFYFFLYSAIGWLIESIYCSVPAKKWINRGFMTGPICPIYGTGAVVMMVFLTPLKEMQLIVPVFGQQLNLAVLPVIAAGMLLCDIVEFITSVLLEKLFHARWWDYSNKPYNLQGRICLGHTLYWGLGALGFMYLAHPLTSYLVSMLKTSAIYGMLIVILAVFFVDLVNAVHAAMDVKKLKDKLEHFKQKLQDKTNGWRTSITEVRLFAVGYQERMAKWNAGRYRKQKGVKPTENLLRRVRKSRTGRLFFGYPILLRDTKRELEVISDMLEEVESDVQKTEDAQDVENTQK